MESMKHLLFEEYYESGVENTPLEYFGEGESVYGDGRQVLVRTCHDALVEYPAPSGERGLILVRRKGEPAMGYIWSIGGGIYRGISIERSLQKKVKEESGMEIEEIRFLSIGRFFWKTTPNQMAKEKGLPLGVDEFSFLFYAKGRGNITLNGLHEEPMIITPEKYTPSFRGDLHPFVRQGMDLAMPFLKR